MPKQPNTISGMKKYLMAGDIISETEEIVLAEENLKYAARFHSHAHLKICPRDPRDNWNSRGRSDSVQRST